MGFGGVQETWEIVGQIDVRDLGGEFRRRKITNFWGGDELLLKYGVRSLHWTWNRCKRVGECIALIAI